MSEAVAPRRAIVVTGAASGMGRATARLFAAQGWFIAAYDVDATGIGRLADELGEKAGLFEPLDVTDAAAYATALDRFGARGGGRLDLLYNNAGIIAHGRFVDMEWATIERILRVNLIGPMIGIRAALPLLRATPNALIMTTCSASAIFGAAGLAAYSASKHGVKGLTEALSAELALDGIRVADVLPGFVETGMMPSDARSRFAAEGPWRLMPPRAVADAVWAAYHGDTLHSYVPPELSEHERSVLDAPLALRDEAAARFRALP